MQHLLTASQAAVFSVHINASVFCLGSGPGRAWSARDQGQYLFELAGRKPNFIQVPVALMDGIIGILDFLTRLFPNLEVGVTSECMLPELNALVSPNDRLVPTCTSEASSRRPALLR